MAGVTLNAEVRTETGKGPAHRLRAAGKIPATIYGKKIKALGIAVNPRELYKAVSSDKGLNNIIHLKISGNSEHPEATVLVKDLQIHPIKRVYLHADFIQVDVADEVTVRVPIHLVGKAEGIVEGGIMQHILREVELTSRVDSIPNFIECDVTPLKIGSSFHLFDLQLPPGVKLAGKTNEAVAACLAPMAEEVEAPVVAAEGDAAAAAPGAEGAAAAPAAGAEKGKDAPAAAGDKKADKK